MQKITAKTILLLLNVSLFAHFSLANDRAILRGHDNVESRLALVIGNSDYRSASLINPVNDASDMTDKLSSFGFRVTTLVNGTQREMVYAIRKFGKSLRKGGVGVFYYAGHGVQVEGRNYLIPTDANMQDVLDVEFEAVDVSRVLKNLKAAGNRLNLVILDACRDNPFANRFRSSQNGLAQLNAPSGTLVAFSTAPGQVSADGAGRNGLFTKHLLQQMRVADLEIGQMFRRVRAAVMKETQSKQVPWENSSLVGDFYFDRQIPVLQHASIKINPASTQSFPQSFQQGSTFPTPQAWYRLGPGLQKIRVKLSKNRDELVNAVVFQDCENCPEMVMVPDRGMAMGKYEVTQGQWRRIMGKGSWQERVETNPSRFHQCGNDCPVENISWDDVQEFIHRLNEKTGKAYRLPTEKEWQQACLAGKRAKYCGSNKLDKVGWFGDNANDKTHAVGQKSPNAWGLYDMTGNVWEWVMDCYDGDCIHRVVRGGSWGDNPLFVRSADREIKWPSSRENDLGFRLALSL